MYAIRSYYVLSIDFAAEWGSQGEPEMMDVEVFVLPFTFSIDFNISTASADANFEILYNSEPLFSVGLDATFADASMEMPINVYGYIQYLSVKFEIDVDVQNINNLVAQVQANPLMYTDVITSYSIHYTKLYEKDQDVKFLINENNGKIVELLLIAGGKDENALISIQGNIDLKTISKLSKSMQIDGLKHLV